MPRLPIWPCSSAPWTRHGRAHSTLTSTTSRKRASICASTSPTPPARSSTTRRQAVPWGRITRMARRQPHAQGELWRRARPCSTRRPHLARPVRRRSHRPRRTHRRALTVSKPITNANLFMSSAKRKIILAAVVAALAVILLGIVVSHWLTVPIARLTAYALAVKNGQRVGCRGSAPQRSASWARPSIRCARPWRERSWSNSTFKP